MITLDVISHHWREPPTSRKATMDTRLEVSEVPDSVALVVRAALRGQLLTDVDTMAAQLEQAGWTPQKYGGAWSCSTAPAWSVESSDHAPNLSIFTRGQDDLVAQTAQRICSLIDAGDLGAAKRGEPEVDWTLWSGGAVIVSLNATKGRSLGQHWAEGMIQLALEREDTPCDGLPDDPQRNLRVAHTGSPVARWYLAAQENLSDVVVELLAGDDDPAVVAALAAGERDRLSRRLHGPSVT